MHDPQHGILITPPGPDGNRISNCVFVNGGEADAVTVGPSSENSISFTVLHTREVERRLTEEEDE